MYGKLSIYISYHPKYATIVACIIASDASSVVTGAECCNNISSNSSNSQTAKKNAVKLSIINKCKVYTVQKTWNTSGKNTQCIKSNRSAAYVSKVPETHSESQQQTANGKM